MNKLKQYLGYVWMLLALVVGYFNIVTLGIPKITSGKQDDLVFGLIVLVVLTPIIVGGLFIFGYYAIKKEYDNE